MNPRNFIILDLDNTVYNWVDAFAPSFRGSIHALHKLTGVGEGELIESFREVFNKHGSLEYKIRTCAELSVFASVPQKMLIACDRLLYAAFQKVWGSKLSLYPHAETFLRNCHRREWPVAALTNAPMDIARRRLTLLGIADYFAAILAAESPSKRRPLSDSSKQVDGFFNELADTTYQELVHDLNPPHLKLSLPKAQMKPSQFGFERLSQTVGKGRQAIVIGDNVARDLAPSIVISGATTIWARFGTDIERRNLNTLLQITPWTSKEIAQASIAAFQPTHVADDWQEILRLVDPEANSGSHLQQDIGPKSAKTVRRYRQLELDLAPIAKIEEESISDRLRA